jgi:hypothetical protein
MSPKAIVEMALTESVTSVRVIDSSGAEVLKAHFASARDAHRLATRTLLEAVALCCNARLRVVLSAESEAIGCAQGLLDGLGYAVDTIYYDVELAGDVRRRRHGQASGRGRGSKP